MFSNVATSAVAFLVALGVLISIHEFGHFWVARRVGIKVLRYSIGFGKALWTRRGKVDDTEFVVAAIPLGGYVKMLDEREGPVAAAEQHRAFNRQPLWARTAVVLAGPLANFLLAIAAYWLVLLTGISGIAPLLGHIDADSAAGQAGFQFEDRIIAVGDDVTPTWNDARIAMLDASLDATEPLAITVESVDGSEHVLQLPVDSHRMLNAKGDAIAELGFSAWWPDVDPVLGEVIAGGAAARAGLQADDRILIVDGVPMESWRDFVEVIQPAANTLLQVVVERDGQPLDIDITPEAFSQGDISIGRIGVKETQSVLLAEKSRVIVRYPLVEAFTKALERTWNMSILTLRMLGKLVTGQASLDNISGPISIAQFAGQTVSIGLDHYINFIALISISLGVLNLLPIPILDGGHLLYFAAEALLGKPLPERVQIWGQQIGMAMLGGLMFVAFYNDIWRLMQ